MHKAGTGQAMSSSLLLRRGIAVTLFGMARVAWADGEVLAADFRDADDLWFGLATAPAHAEDQLNDSWVQFARRGQVRAWTNTPRAAERLRFWTNPEADIKLAADTGIGVYRLGVDWGRLVPECELDRAEPCGVQDWAVLDEYERTLQLVRKHKMKVMLSLFHHSFPSWGQTFGRDETNEGAAMGELFQHRNSAGHFVAFATDVVRRLAPLVDYWVTINEPVVFNMLTHCMGIWPPGPRVVNPMARLNCMTNPHTGSLLAQAHMIDGHRQIYSFIRRHEREAGLPFAPVGVAHLVMDSRPLSAGLDSGSTLFIDLYAKYLFIDLVKDAIDFCGINYYGLEVVTGIGPGLAPKEVEYSGSGRGISPAGLVNMLQSYQDRYAHDPNARFMNPGGYGFVITENGIADSEDILRPAYLVEHIMAVHAARARGIRVRGYTFWTAADNWEWADGYCPKFGLAAVNRSDPRMPRVPRPSYHLFSRIVQTRTVTQADRDWAWRRVVSASSSGRTKEVCRTRDAVGSLDTPDRWPVLGGSRLPDGRTVDWRFNISDVKPAGQKKEDAAIATDFILSSMALSKSTGIDPAAAFVSALAAYGAKSLRPPPPPAPPGGAASSDLFGMFTKGFIHALHGAQAAHSGGAAGTAGGGTPAGLRQEPLAAAGGGRGGGALAAVGAAAAGVAALLALARRRIRLAAALL